MTAVISHIQSHTATAAATVVEARGLGKVIDDRTVLRGVDLDIQNGEFIALIGANGAGKSTLLRLLSLLSRPSAGELNLFGRSTAGDNTPLRSRIGVIGHQPMLYRDLSARENLHFFAGLYGVADPKRRTTELLNRMDLHHRANDAVKTFSSGMTQRLAIARAILHSPELLLADEPFSGLDVRSTGLIENLFTELHRAGHTIIMVNHDLAQCLRLSRRVVVLSGGSVSLSAASDRMTVEQLVREVDQP